MDPAASVPGHADETGDTFLGTHMSLSKRAVECCLWCISGLVLGSALTKTRLVSGVFTLPHFWEQGVTILFFGSAVMGAIGLPQSKPWGFVAVYVYILTATFLLPASVVPFLFGFVSLDIKTSAWLLLIANFAVLTLAVYLHILAYGANKELKEAT
jgi:hypothetical protein